MIEALKAPTVRPDDASMREARMMRKGSANLLLAIMQARGQLWACGHARVEANAHRVGSVIHCRICRQRDLTKMVRDIAAKRRIKEWESRVEEFQARPVQQFPKWYNPFKEKASIGSTVCRMVAADFSVTEAEVRGASRVRHLVEARAIVTRVLCERGWSYPRVGKLLGGRDHSTCINLYQKFPIFCNRNPRVFEVYEKFRALMEKAQMLEDMERAEDEADGAS